MAADESFNALIPNFSENTQSPRRRSSRPERLRTIGANIREGRDDLQLEAEAEESNKIRTIFLDTKSLEVTLNFAGKEQNMVARLCPVQGAQLKFHSSCDERWLQSIDQSRIDAVLVLVEHL
jgi:hypothetical protein